MKRHRQKSQTQGIRIGKVYQVRVNGVIQDVRITGGSPRRGWDAVNIATGKPVRITIEHALFEVPGYEQRKTTAATPEVSEPVDALANAIRDSISPEAVAAIVAYLQPAQTNDPEVDRQVQWFAERLIETLGGPEQQSRLAEELGL